MLSWLRPNQPKRRLVKESKIISDPMGRNTVLPGVSPEQIRESIQATLVKLGRLRDERTGR